MRDRCACVTIFSDEDNIADNMRSVYVSITKDRMFTKDR